MINQCISYESQRYYPLRAAFYYLLFYISGTALVILCARREHNIVIGAIGWGIVMIIPFVYKKSIQAFFSNSALINADNNDFKIKEYSLRDDTLLKNVTIPWNDVKAYNFGYSRGNITNLNIYLNNGENKKFHFKDDKNVEEAFHGKSTFSIFYYFVIQHNTERKIEDKISFRPGFMTTRAGGILLYSLIAIAVADIIIHITLSPGTSYYSIITALFFISVLIKSRLDDMGLYKMMNQLRRLDWQKLNDG